jgi:Asp-tRNA(Asn)/Glu-tRNA(Gln) amidotransferase A subunit family amidase
MSSHTQNEIWGCAKNPWNIHKTCGGSSGGDAALVAARCVPLAIGTDIGGSVRGPAVYNGVRGFKSSGFRTSYQGHSNVFRNGSTPFNSIRSS